VRVSETNRGWRWAVVPVGTATQAAAARAAGEQKAAPPTADATAQQLAADAAEVAPPQPQIGDPRLAALKEKFRRARKAESEEE